ncbi:hypothetical protein [Raineyella sp. LH-20]|uniref:hypothetical protein n=1 Tax=Raineyella sp. LH-20 TaxID=3081204 RepID=UPI002953BFB3|nr:hypothetical protein [Raineyella sp. LH-20]WOP18812.1 hypothetical protein R0146_00630 [Raineyella sp. LH-20]
MAAAGVPLNGARRAAVGRTTLATAAEMARVARVGVRRMQETSPRNRGVRRAGSSSTYGWTGPGPTCEAANVR